MLVDDSALSLHLARVQAPCGEPTEIRTRRGTIAGLSWGARSAPRKFLALHGWCEHAASFERLGPLHHDAHVVAIDLPGHGLSYRQPDGASYTPQDWLVDLCEVVDALGWLQCTMVGHSLGGTLAAAFTATNPERVSKLVLLDSLGAMPLPEVDFVRRMGGFVTRLRAIEGRAQRPVYKSYADMVAAVLRKGVVTLEVAALMIQRGARAVPTGFEWTTDERLMIDTPLLFLGAQPARAILRGVSRPTLVVLGRRGVWAGDASKPTTIDRLECLREATVVWIDAGHHPHVSHAVETAREIATFHAS